MPRGRGRGGKRPAKKGGFGSKRELLFKEAGEEYAQVLKLLGGSKMEVHCMDNKKRIAKVRGKFKRRVWVNVGDIILVALREFEDDRCDIIHVFYADEAKSLKAMGEIPQDINISEQQKQENNDLNIAFDDEKDDENKLKKKSEKQNLDNYMPTDSSDEDDDSEEEQKPSRQAPVKPKDQKPVSVLDKAGPVTTGKKPQTKIQESSSEEESGEDSDGSEEKEVDELDDI